MEEHVSAEGVSYSFKKPLFQLLIAEIQWFLFFVPGVFFSWGYGSFTQNINRLEEVWGDVGMEREG